MDVHNDFVHCDLQEEVYMKFLPGFGCWSNHNLVCRLRKSLYELKQALCYWFAKLVTALKGQGIVFFSHILIILYSPVLEVLCNSMSLFVDDLIISKIASVALKVFKAHLSDCFKMKDHGSLKHFLGIKVARYSKSLFLCQRICTFDIISKWFTWGKTLWFSY